MINSWFSDSWVYSIGWALFHSVWHIALISLLCYSLLRLFRKASATFRYYLMVAGMMTCLLLAGTMAWMEWQNQVEKASSVITISQQELTPPGQKTEAPALDGPTDSEIIWQALDHFFQKNMNTLVLLWLFGVVLFTVRLIGAYAFLSHLQVWGVAVPPRDWQSRWSDLVQRMGVQKPVEFLASQLVVEPATFGHFKPVVLFPVALFTQLEPAQVEALLLHELAHIKRRDFLVNLLQSLLESLFFYHPGIWWMSKAIRELREECCDDLVLQCDVQAVDYAETLLTVQKYFSIQPKLRLAMKTSGNSTHLGVRIRRLLQVEQPLNYWRLRLSRVFLLATVGLLLLVLGACTGMMLRPDSTISVAADKMNVFYLGIENPITVAVAGVPSNQVELTSEDLALTDLGEGRYNANPKELGEAKIKVLAGGKEVRTVVFRVKRIPDPVARVGKTTGGTYPAEQFRSANSVNILINNFDFDARCEVVEFSVVRVGKKEDPVEVINHGAAFSETTLGLIKKAKPGDIYYFDQVTGQCPGDTEPRKLNAMVYKLK